MNEFCKSFLMHKSGGGSSWDTDSEKKLKEYLKPTGLGQKILDGASSIVNSTKKKVEQNKKLSDLGYDPGYGDWNRSVSGGGSSWEKQTFGGGSTWGNTPKSTQSSKQTTSNSQRYLADPSKDYWNGSTESIKSDILRRWDEGRNKVSGYASKRTDSQSDTSNQNKNSSYTAPETWGKEGSQEFKDNKKAYNQWYYQQHKEYWKRYASGLKNEYEDALKRAKDLQNTQRTKNIAESNMAMQEAYKRAGEARGQAMGNVGKTRVSDVSSSSSAGIGSRIMNQISESSGKTSFASLFKSGLNSIVNIGKSILSKIFG